MQLLRVYNLEHIGQWTPLPPGVPPPPGAVVSAQAYGPVVQPQPVTDEEATAIRDRASGCIRTPPRRDLGTSSRKRSTWTLAQAEAHLPAAERKRLARERHYAAAEAAAEILRRRKTPQAVREALAVWLAGLSDEALAAAARLAEPSATRAARKWARRQARRKRKEERAKQTTELVTID